MKLFRKIAIGLCAFAAVICIVSAKPAAAEAATKYYITTSSSSLTKKASPSSDKVGSVPSGVIVVVKDASNKNYYKINYCDSDQKNHTGYISAKKIKKASTYKVEEKTPLLKTKSKSAKKHLTLAKGASVCVLSTSGDFRRVTYFAGNGKVYTGYIEKKAAKTKSSGSSYKTTNTVRMRKNAKEASDVVTTVPKGSKVTVTDSTNQYWARVTYTNAKKKSYVGYISKKFLVK